MDKKILLSIYCFFVSVTFSVSQSLERSVIATTGHSYSGPTFFIDYTIGEVFILTYSNSTNILTQGFQQPGTDTVVSVYEIKNRDISFVLYPNPASEFITTFISDPLQKDLRIEVFDMLGSLLIERKLKSVHSSGFQEKINIDRLSPGSYLIKLYEENVLIECLKFIKVN